ncbi:hypothetical protein FRB91_011885 [Serendipita sp. 411]|nr:hypothetical protein FRC18_009188 [Serendipita sp. 400]KAG8847346.1 hypothetical protein FRB91_011885 [Serendipita sp. 411]
MFSCASFIAHLLPPSHLPSALAYIFSLSLPSSSLTDSVLSETTDGAQNANNLMANANGHPAAPTNTTAPNNLPLPPPPSPEASTSTSTHIPKRSIFLPAY